jgi:hypothetical protein
MTSATKFSTLEVAMRTRLLAGATLLTGLFIAGDAPGEPPPSRSTPAVTTAGMSAGSATTPTPPPRTGFVGVYSRARSAAFVVGGSDGAGHQLGDIWEY